MVRGLGSWVFLQALKVPVRILGVVVVGIVVYAHLEVLPTFVRPDHKAFWDDVTAYRLRAPGHKSLDELYRDYDPELVHRFAVAFSAFPGFVPSEKAMLDCWLDVSLDGGDPPRVRSTVYLAFAIVWFPFLYFPALYLLNVLARNY